MTSLYYILAYVVLGRYSGDFHCPKTLEQIPVRCKAHHSRIASG